MKESVNMPEENDFPLVPEGFHKVFIEKVERRTSSNGDRQYNLIMQVDDSNQKLFDLITICEDKEKPANRILWRFRVFLKALGLPHAGSPLEFDMDEWINRKVEVQVVHDTYEGKTRAKVKNYIPQEENKQTTPKQEFPPNQGGEETEEF